jgi:hypothetical protein
MMALSEQSVSDGLLVRYLLGQLSVEEAEPLDQRSIADDDFAHRLDQVERDLIDSYVRGELLSETSTRFKSYYLSSPLRIQRVAFAQALLQGPKPKHGPELSRAEASPAASSRSSFWSRFSSSIAVWSLAGAAAGLALAAYLGTQNVALRRQAAVSETHEALLTRELDEQRSAAASAAQALEQMRSSQANLDQLKAAALVLPPPTRGAARLASLTVPKDAALVVLFLGLDSADFKVYRAVLRDTSSNRAVWQSGELAPAEGKFVSLSFPAKLLHSQTYIVELSGARANGSSESIGNYAFRVTTG